MQNIKDIIESLLFVADEPLTIDKLKTVLETADAKTIRTALDGLADQYTARGGGFFLCEVAGGWQLRSRPEYNEWIKRMLQPSPQRLTKAALETLAIVAYNQPIIRADIEHIRGVDCGGVLRQLMERKLIRVLGRKEIPGRPMIYATTKLFLELFNLKSLRDLPSPKEMEELGGSEDPLGQQPAMGPQDQAVAPVEGIHPPGGPSRENASRRSAGSVNSPHRPSRIPVQPPVAGHGKALPANGRNRLPGPGAGIASARSEISNSRHAVTTADTGSPLPTAAPSHGKIQKKPVI